MRKLFGTDGVRGVANKELTPELAYKLGRYAAYVIKHKENSRVVIGKDTRISGDLLEHALIAGILSVGCDAFSAGIIPTPGISYITRQMDFDLGIVISASHNPLEFNGIKFFNHDGFKLTDEQELEIEDYIFERKTIDKEYINENIGRHSILEGAVNMYADFLISTVEGDLSGIKIGVDAANGAAYKACEEVFSRLSADVSMIHHKPNGLNINKNCGSTHLEDLIKYVKETDLDMGIAFDGDADRLLAVDEDGNIVDGDKIIAICASYLKEENKLKNNTAVVTVMSNMGFDKCLEERDIKVSKTKVGDRYVLEEMRKNDYSIGGEQSGHIIFFDYNTTGDGILSALKLLEIVKKSGKKLSELASIMTVYPQVLVNVKVSNENKMKYLEDDVIKEKIHDVEKMIEGKGRVLIRPSGTEPLIRVMLEGESIELIENYASEIADIIKERLN